MRSIFYFVKNQPYIFAQNCKAPNKSEIRINKIPTRVPKPSNGTPLTIQLYVWNIKTVIDTRDVIIERNIDSFKGLFENEIIPLKANERTLKVVAFDMPENRSFWKNLYL